MIANKVLPAFYIVDLEGEAANFEWLFGGRHHIKNIRIGSKDFRSDIDAFEAGKQLTDFLLDNVKLSDDYNEEHTLNPEFYPSVPPIQLTAEQQEHLDEVAEQAAEMASEGKLAMELTRHFDKLGDFITTNVSSVGENFKVNLKVAINPTIYMDEKAKDKEFEMNSAAGPHRFKIIQAPIH